jgi:hypothetical protein
VGQGCGSPDLLVKEKGDGETGADDVGDGWSPCCGHIEDMWGVCVKRFSRGRNFYGRTGSGYSGSCL